MRGRGAPVTYLFHTTSFHSDEGSHHQTLGIAHLVSAAFDNHADAELGMSERRAAGVKDSAIPIVAQHASKKTTTDGDGGTQKFVGNVAAGAKMGTLLGIAARAIPRVGPLFVAGAIASAALAERLAALRRL